MSDSNPATIIAVCLESEESITCPRSYASHGTAVSLTSSAAAFASFAPAVTMGGPNLAAAWTGGAPGAARVVATRRLDRDGGLLGCDFSALIVAAPGAHPLKICGVPPEIWDALSPGDVLLLTGEVTPRGVRYRSIRRAPR